jgi:hypothetical protein
MSTSIIQSDSNITSLMQLPTLSVPVSPARKENESFNKLGVALVSEMWARVQEVISIDWYGKVEPSVYEAAVYLFVKPPAMYVPLFLERSLRRRIAPTMEIAGYALCRVRGLYATTRDARDSQGFAIATEILVRPFKLGLPYSLDETIASVAEHLGSLIPDEELP